MYLLDRIFKGLPGLHDSVVKRIHSALFTQHDVAGKQRRVVGDMQIFSWSSLLQSVGKMMDFVFHAF